MKVIPLYKVICPYNYEMIIRNIEKNYAQRDKIYFRQMERCI